MISILSHAPIISRDIGNVTTFGKEILLNPIGDGYIETQLMVERLSVDWLIGIDYEPQVVFDKFEERRQKYVYTT